MIENKQTGNLDLIRPFAPKSNKKKIVFNDTAVTYNRCSTEKQQSVEWQEKITAEYVRNHNWTLVKSFGEKESASTNDRDEYQEMMKFCVKEKIGHIVFYSYDRFSRTGDNSVLDGLEEDGIKIHAATQEVNSDTPSGKMTQRLYMLFAKMENDQRREKIIEGLKNKLRKGEWITNPPLGYTKRYITGEKAHDHDKRQCFIDEKGELLRQAFFWKDNENLTDNEIVTRLKTMGLILTPRQLTRIFRNPFYCGYVTHSLLDEGEVIRGKHEPLVDEAMFLRINGVLDKRPHGWKKVNHDDELPLKLSVRCANCDQPLTGYVQKKIYYYYKCRNKGCCVNLSAKKLHQLFGGMLSGFAVDSKLIPAVKTQLESTFYMLHQSESAREKPMKDEMTRLKNELEIMELKLATDKLPLELYLKHSEAHKQKIAAIEGELEILGRDTSNLGLYLDKALQNSGNLSKMWEKLDLEGKIRLQKLIYPSGIQYQPENGTLRTLEVNPIFSAISSISKILEPRNDMKERTFDLINHQVYLGFRSSNFLWENLEKTAVTFKALRDCVYTSTTSTDIITHITSISDATPTFYESNLSEMLEGNIKAPPFSPPSVILTGFTTSFRSQLL